METWNHIYSHFNPIAFELGSLKVHWYGIMYALAFLIAIFFAKYIVKHDKMNIKENILDNYIFWVEVGVILGARLGYVLFYDPHTYYYLTHPWQIFNPFVNGVFVGIRGMSYHGAIIGFLIAAFLFARKHKQNIWFLLDIAAIVVPLAYTAGRIGNFLNQELVGRETTSSFGIYVDGILRHPSQLYEAVLEGLLVFAIIFLYRKRKKFDGELIIMYGVLYAITRAIAEIFRAPDFHIGFVCCDLFTMGQILSSFMFFGGIILYFILQKKRIKKTTK